MLQSILPDWFMESSVIGQTQKIIYFFSHFFYSGSNKTNFDAIFLRAYIRLFFGSFAVVLLLFSLNQPTWPIQSLSCVVCENVVCLSVHPL